MAIANSKSLITADDPRIFLNRKMFDDALMAMRGWLESLDGPSPKRSFCILVDNELKFFASETDSTPREVIRIEDISHVKSVSKLSKPAFQLILPKSCRTFGCQTLGDSQRWLCALSSHHLLEAISIADFELLRTIGRGASGKVTLARHLKSGDLYAIKSIRKDKLSAHAREFRVLAERNILMRAAHQFITRLYWAFQTPAKFYFVLEYVQGGDLRHHIDQRVDFSAAQIQLYLAELVVALRTLHDLGIVYRDLKPENILVDLNGHLKLADFGLARQMETDIANRAMTLCGTYEYLAPEMVKQEGQSFALDYWALGVLAYRLIVGHLPFQSANIGKLFDMILKSNPKIPRSMDKTAASFITALLVKDPSKRLGAQPGVIMEHPYFQGLSWEKVSNMEYEPEFKPTVTRDDSVSNFDELYTSESPRDSFAEQIVAVNFNLQNFSYQSDDLIMSLQSWRELSKL
jgi:serine/threonine protein kinase